jgi:hypothetical protein
VVKGKGETETWYLMGSRSDGKRTKRGIESEAAGTHRQDPHLNRSPGADGGRRRRSGLGALPGLSVWLARLQFGDLSPSRGDELLVRVRVSGEPPPAIGRLRQKDPGALSERRVAGRLNDESGESAHDRELLVTIEGARVREDLDPHVGGISVDVREARRRSS